MKGSKNDNAVTRSCESLKSLRTNELFKNYLQA